MQPSEAQKELLRCWATRFRPSANKHRCSILSESRTDQSVVYASAETWFQLEVREHKLLLKLFLCPEPWNGFYRTASPALKLVPNINFQSEEANIEEIKAKEFCDEVRRYWCCVCMCVCVWWTWMRKRKPQKPPPGEPDSATVSTVTSKVAETPHMWTPVRDQPEKTN